MEHDPVVDALNRRVNCVTGVVLSYVAVAVAAAGAAYSAYSAHEAAAEQKKIAEQNAARIKAENEEALRRLKKQQASNLSEARARAAASGMGVGGTQKSYLDEMADAFKSETDWLRASGASQAAITQREGIARADATRSQGIATGIKGMSSAIGGYYG